MNVVLFRTLVHVNLRVWIGVGGLEPILLLPQVSLGYAVM